MNTFKFKSFDDISNKKDRINAIKYKTTFNYFQSIFNNKYLSGFLVFLNVLLNKMFNYTIIWYLFSIFNVSNIEVNYIFICFLGFISACSDTIVSLIAIEKKRNNFE